MQRSSTSSLWLDRKGLAWIDPASREAWDYNLAIAADAATRGCDELNFDYVCPIVYPSHFAPKFLGFVDPAAHPYEVVNHSMRHAAGRLSPTSKAKLRPWLQDFSLGARYDPVMVKARVQAVRDALGERYSGFLLWSSSNRYTREALK